MFVKPNTNPKYAGIKDGEPGFEPGRIALKVFDPALKNHLPPEGRDVGSDNELYWTRRVIGGEVTVLSAEDGQKSLEAADRARAAEAAAAAADKKPAAPAPSKGEAAGGKTEK